MAKRFKPKDANEEYQRLGEYAEQRGREIGPMLEPFTAATDKYGRLLCRVCLIVSEHPPETIQDAVVRDLMADVFDFLFESRHFLQKGQTLVAFPLARRAYESLSLLHWCILDEKAAESWARGKKVSNHEIRRALADHPMGESEEELKKLYNFFCSMTHPNREMIAYRGLGEGNRFVFGSVGIPNLVELCDYCLKHLAMWHWFCPAVVWFYRERVLDRDRTLNHAMKETRKSAEQVSAWLVEQFNNVLEEWKNDSGIVKPRFS